jgi:transposase
MLKSHLDNLLTWWENRITNAVSEGLNSKIQTVKSAARGFHTALKVIAFASCSSAESST